jgi:tetratricopeptide (TPR) repeat protein
MDVFSVSADSLFPIASEQNAQKEQYAMRFLQKGLEEYTAGEYRQAMLSFKQAVGLAPQSSTAINAYDYIANSQVKLGDTEAAIETYKTMLKADTTRDATRISLGNLYYANDRFDEALGEYEQAVAINPSVINRYALGQALLATDQAGRALQEFTRIKQEAPTQPQGDFGIGQAHAKLERYDEAIASFKSAISIKRDYWEAYAEMGYAFMDSGDAESAKAMVSELKGKDDSLASLLSQYVFEKAPPKLIAAYPSSSFAQFLTALGPGTQVANMDTYLATAGNEKTFALDFVFSKPMDRSSVENVFNWTISRAAGTGIGDGYNFGSAVKDTEITLPRNPYAVYYDSNTLTATMLFKVSQNDTANGTLDPSHINFSFNGKDEFNLTMDKDADAYTGFSGVA